MIFRGVNWTENMISRTVPWVWVWCHLWTCFQTVEGGSRSIYSIIDGVRSLDFGRERGARETLKASLRFCVLSMASTILHVHQWLQLMGTCSC